MKKLILPFFTLLSISLSAQNKSSNRIDDKQEERLEHPNTIKLTPLKFVGLYHSSLEFSYQRYASNNRAIQFTYGKLLDQLDQNSNDDISFKGHSLALEHKWFVDQDNKPFYISLELGGLFRQGNQVGKFNNTTVRDSSGNIESFSYDDTIHVQYRQLYFAPKIGWEKRFNNGFTIDTYIGIGIAHKYSKHTNRINPQDETNDFYSTLAREGDDLRQIIIEEKNRLDPKFLFNIRVGYSF